MLFLFLMLFLLLCYWCYSFRRFCLTAAAILMILLTRVGIVATAKLLLLQLLSFLLIVNLLLFAAIIVSTAKMLLRQLL